MVDFDADARVLAGHLGWLVTRTRTMTDTKLAGHPRGCATNRADLVRGLLQQLTDAEVGLVFRAGPAEPAWRSVPVLRDLAVGDQLAVLGHDLVSALGEVAERAAVPDPSAAWTIWTRAGRRPLDEVVARLADDAGRLRELL